MINFGCRMRLKTVNTTLCYILPIYRLNHQGLVLKMLHTNRHSNTIGIFTTHTISLILKLTQDIMKSSC